MQPQAILDIEAKLWSPMYLLVVHMLRMHL